MRSHRSFLCLLLCACILFGLFSVSAFAIEDDQSYFNGEEVGLNIVDENGFSLLATDIAYTVKNYWKTASSSSWTNYTNSIITDTQYDSLDILFEITLTSEIEINSNFDVTLNLYSDNYNSLVVTDFKMYDTNGNPSNSDIPSITLNGTRVHAINIFNNLAAANKLEFYFTVNNPSYTLDDGSGGGVEPEVSEATTEAPTEPSQPTNPTFILNGNYEHILEFEKGMNWGDWVDSEYNTIGLIVTTWYDRIGYEKGFSTSYVTLDGKSDFVDKYDTIIENYNYIMPIGSTGWPIGLENYIFEFYTSSINISILTDEETQGGILGWIKNIFNSIKNLPTNIASKISGFFTELGNKISALGDAIINGIKGLFIPTEDSIEEMKTKFEQLLEDRFGAVYESTAVIDNFANAFFNTAQVQAATDTGGTIHFPLVSVPLAGTEFSFGGWDVDLIPDSFEGIVELLKMATDIVCTFVFINALRKKLEGILR